MDNLHVGGTETTSPSQAVADSLTPANNAVGALSSARHAAGQRDSLYQQQDHTEQFLAGDAFTAMPFCMSDFEDDIFVQDAQ